MLARLRHQLVAAWSWVRRYPYYAVAVPVVLALSISFLTREDSEWEEVYVVAARHLREGPDIYSDGNSYPPFATLLALPASFLAPGLLRWTWLLVNLAGLVVMVRGAWHSAGGGPLQGATGTPRGEHIAALMGLVCGAGYLHNCLAHQQTDVVIGALLVLGCLALARSRSMVAATCFGIAAAIKCTALLWIPYLVWRRRPLAALWVGIVPMVLSLLPNLVSSPPSGGLWLGEYANRFLRPLTTADHVVGTWGSDIIYNQSLAGAAQRWLIADRDQPVTPEVLRLIVLGVEGVLVGTSLWVCGAPFRRVDSAAGRGFAYESSEHALVLVLMLLLSPMSSKAHFGVLLVPGFLVARAAALSGSKLLWGCILLSTMLACVSHKDFLGEDGYTLMLWYGAATWEALVLWLGCVAVAWRSRHGRGVMAGGLANASPPSRRAA
jgi:hypothetical protein